MSDNLAQSKYRLDKMEEDLFFHIIEEYQYEEHKNNSALYGGLIIDFNDFINAHPKYKKKIRRDGVQKFKQLFFEALMSEIKNFRLNGIEICTNRKTGEYYSGAFIIGAEYYKDNDGNILTDKVKIEFNEKYIKYLGNKIKGTPILSKYIAGLDQEDTKVIYGYFKSLINEDDVAYDKEFLAKDLVTQFRLQNNKSYIKSPYEFFRKYLEPKIQYITDNSEIYIMRLSELTEVGRTKPKVLDDN